jgi:Trypsin
LRYFVAPVRAAVATRRGGYGGGVARRLIRGLGLAVLVAGIAVGNASSSARVVGGTPIQVQSAPWSVFVTYDVGNGRFQCTGSVIDASHILTAAHCLFDYSGALASPSALAVQAGISNYSSPASTDLVQDRTVGSFRVHPGYVYQDTGLPDDIAVLTLSAPLDLSGPAVQAVALPAPNAPYPVGAGVSISGFGLQNGADDTSTGPLVTMSTTVEPQGQCGEFTDTQLIEYDNAVMLCTITPASSLCSGDSGSGLVTTSGTPTLIGVADAAEPGCPAGHDNISAYVGAPELLSFIEGNDQPPTAPRPTSQTTSYKLTWGDPLVAGDTLTCSTSGWPEPVQSVYSFVNAGTGAVLQTGPAPTYVLPASAVGTEILCQIAVTDAGGTTIVRTTSTSSIAAAPHASIQPPAPLSAKRGQDITVHVILRSRAGLSGAFTVCATLPASVGGHLCHSVHEAFGASGNFPFAFIFKIKKTAPLRTVRIAISATAGTSTAKTTELLRITKPKH